MRSTHPKTENAQETKASTLKMKALTAATGVSKATIAHYVKEGLLPMPKRTSRNMAYYDVSCVERVLFIKKMQANHRLPLSQIKLILEQRDKGREVSPLIELKEIIFGLEGPIRMDLPAFSKATNLSPGEVETCLSAKLLRPREKGCFDMEDVAAGQVLRMCIDLGISVTETAYYSRLAEDVVEKEMAIQKRLTKNKPYEEAIHTTMELTRVARTLRAYIFDRVFQERAMLQENSRKPKSRP
jgi:DNA-binding transcriptional MerR regulator